MTCGSGEGRRLDKKYAFVDRCKLELCKLAISRTCMPHAASLRARSMQNAGNHWRVLRLPHLHSNPRKDGLEGEKLGVHVRHNISFEGWNFLNDRDRITWTFSAPFSAFELLNFSNFTRANTPNRSCFTRKILYVRLYLDR